MRQLLFWCLMTWLCRKRPKPPTEWLRCFSSLWKSLRFLFFSCTLNMTTKLLLLWVRFSRKRESSQATAVEWPRSTTLFSVSRPPSKLLSLLSLYPFLPPLSPPFPMSRQLGQIYSGLCPSLLAGQAASFDWVLIRTGRLVTGYLLRGQWGLSSVIQWKVGSLRWLCGSVWPRMWPAILADTLLPEDMVLLQTVISHVVLRDSLSVTIGPPVLSGEEDMGPPQHWCSKPFLPQRWAHRRGPSLK